MPHPVTLAARATDLTHLPARELAALVRVGRLSAQDVVLAHLGGTSGTDARRATAQAVRLDTRLHHGIAGGALAGVPVLAGPGLAAAARLQTAGAVVLGHAAADDAAAAVASGLVPLALVSGDRSVGDTAVTHALVGLDLRVGPERVGLLARDVRDAGLALGVLGDRPLHLVLDGSGGGTQLSLPTGSATAPAARATAQAQLLTAAARARA